MTDRLKDWAFCEYCNVPVPVIHSVDGKQCGRCLRPYTKLLPLLVVDHRSGDHGLVTLQEAGRIIRPKHRYHRFMENLAQQHKTSFPKPVLVLAGRNLYNIDDLSEWFEAYVRRPRHPKESHRMH